MLFNKKDFNEKNKTDLLQRAFSFANFIIEDNSKLHKLNLTNGEKTILIYNLICIHEDSDLFEICIKLKKIKDDLIPVN